MAKSDTRLTHFIYLNLNFKVMTGQPLKRSLQCRSPTIPLHHMSRNSLCPSCCIRLFIDLSSACSMITAAQALHCSLLQACRTNDNSLHLLFLSTPPHPSFHHSQMPQRYSPIWPQTNGICAAN